MNDIKRVCVFASKQSSELFFLASTPQEAVQYIKNYIPKDIRVTKEHIYQR